MANFYTPADLVQHAKTNPKTTLSSVTPSLAFYAHALKEAAATAEEIDFSYLVNNAQTNEQQEQLEKLAVQLGNLGIILV